MITEDYVNLEIAKLLKEKGFDEKCSKFWLYNKNDTNEVCLVSCGLLGDTNLELNNSQIDTLLNDNKNGYSAPTHQMAMKWLREVHSLHIAVIVTYQHTPRKHEAHIMKLENVDDFILHQNMDFDSYEEACEAAIKYCLENLM